LDTDYLDSTFKLCDITVYYPKYTLSEICRPSRVEAVVVMIVEYKVGVIPILKPLFHVFDAWNELLLPFILDSKCLPEVVLGNYDVCADFCLLVRSVKQVTLPPGIFSTLHGAHSACFNHLVVIIPGCPQSEGIYQGEAFNCLVSLTDYLCQSRGVYCQGNQRDRSALGYTCQFWVTMQGISSKYGLHRPV
jgi:hypothetical protein